MTYDDAVAQIRNSSFAPYADYLISKLLPTIEIAAARCSLDELAPGASRFAGEPDVPPDFEWPHGPDGEPLFFLAQFDLEQVAAIHRDPLLPTTGWLLFFYDNDAWGFKVEHYGCWRVIWVEAERDALQRTPSPSGTPATEWSPCALRFQQVYSLPTNDALVDADPEAPLAQALANLTETTADNSPTPQAYRDELAALVRNPLTGHPGHRLLGHACEVQQPMPGSFHKLVEAVPDKHGTNPFTGEKLIFRGHPAPNCTPELKELLGESEDWRLLFQAGSDEAGPGWVWVDVGRLYFWIPRSQLQRRDFSAAWMQLQTT